MRAVTAKVFDDVFALIELARGSRPRTEYLRHVIGLGIQAEHAQAMKNAPKEPWLAPLKVEGESAYLDPAFAERMDAAVKRVRYWG